MRGGRFFMLVGLLAAATALLVAPGAPAATSKQIYADYAADGRFDRVYSRAELRRVLNDAWVQGYGHPTVLVAVKRAVHTQLRSPKRGEVLGAAATESPLRRAQKRGTLPFTGFDVGLLFGGAALLLVVGGGLRRLSADKA